jgi:hypothetical protein
MLRHFDKLIARCAAQRPISDKLSVRFYQKLITASNTIPLNLPSSKMLPVGKPL